MKFPSNKRAQTVMKIKKKNPPKTTTTHSSKAIYPRTFNENTPSILKTTDRNPVYCSFYSHREIYT